MGTVVSPREAKEVIRRHLGPPGELRRRMDPPSFEGFQLALSRVERSVEELDRRTGVPVDPILVAAVALCLVLEVLVPYLRGRTDEAAKVLAKRYSTLRAVEPKPASDREKLFRAYLQSAAAGATEALQSQRGVEVLTRLANNLKLSFDDIGYMLKVSGETVRRWARGTISIPDDHLATVDLLRVALDRLETMFLPDRLPQVIRRPADLFEGERAMDWILRGRLRDVADRYEVLLRYQA